MARNITILIAMHTTLNSRTAKLIFVIGVLFIVTAVVSGHMIQTVLVPSTFLLKGLHAIGWNSAVEYLFPSLVALGKWNDKTFKTSFIVESVSVSVDKEKKRFIRVLKTDIKGPFNWRLYSVGAYKSIPFPRLPRPSLPPK